MSGISLKPEFEGFRPRLESAMHAMGLAQDDSHVSAMLAYLQQLQHWNRAYNLTAVRAPADMLVQHVFDSLVILPALRAYSSGNDIRVADMGSGAGLPGIILAICEPGWDVACVDAVSKKTAFIRQVAGVLGLSNVQAIHGRIESLSSLQADIVISRAFASLTDFVRVASHHRKPDGVMLAMKGIYPQDECITLENSTPWRVVAHQDLHVPELQAQRCLLELKETDD